MTGSSWEFDNAASGERIRYFVEGHGTFGGVWMKPENGYEFYLDDVFFMQYGRGFAKDLETAKKIVESFAEWCLKAKEILK